MLYRYRKANHVPVRSLIEGIMNNIRDVYSDQISRLEFQVNGPEFELDTAKADPLALIVNELITNAVKHAFEPDQPGVIQVLLERHDDIDGNSLVDITVSDNGKGLKTSTPGNDKAGIGLNLLGRLGEQLLGEVRLMDSPVGTQWKISFPE
jgi:two-component sensor histidine kinase